jgi:PhoPQ-activated pathogenicity-related protein
VVDSRPRPNVKWTFERDGSIRVVATEIPAAVRLWQATNPNARNFRLDAIGPAYRSTNLNASGPNTWVGRVPKPRRGWTAFFVELTFDGAGRYPLKVTSGIRVVPDTLPYPAPVPARAAAQGVH